MVINEEGVSSQSFHVKSLIRWADMNKIQQTAQGWLLYHGAGRHYVSGRYLSDEAQAFIDAKAKVIAP